MTQPRRALLTEQDCQIVSNSVKIQNTILLKVTWWRYALLVMPRYTLDCDETYTYVMTITQTCKLVNNMTG